MIAIKRGGRLLRKVVVVSLAVIWAIVSLYPILYMIFESFGTQATYITGKPWLPPLHLYFGNYRDVWEAGFARYFLNSAVVAVVAVALILIVGLMEAYAIVRLDGWFSSRAFTFFLADLAIPIQAGIIPLYVLIEKLGFYDTLWAMILPSVAFALPLSVLILVNFVRDIPKELYQTRRKTRCFSYGDIRRLPLGNYFFVTQCMVFCNYDTASL